MRTLELWYARVDVDELARSFQEQASSADAKRLERDLAKARTKDSLKAFAKLTREGPDAADRRRPAADRSARRAIPTRAARARPRGHRGLIRGYRRTLQGDRRRLVERFRYVDAAHKVVGVGSVGTRAWIVLMLGRDVDDPLFLQAKEGRLRSSSRTRERYSNHGRRVVEGQRLIQAGERHPARLDPRQGDGGVTHDFYVRHSGTQGSASVETMSPPVLEDYARLCGWTLAKAHARAGDPIALASYLGTSDVFDRALAGSRRPTLTRTNATTPCSYKPSMPAA